MNFKQFEFFVIHCDIIDRNTNFNNLVKSEILCSVPVKTFDFGELLHYEFSNPPTKKCKDKFREIRFRITDELDKPINLNDGVVQYEFVITRKIN